MANKWQIPYTRSEKYNSNKNTDCLPQSIITTICQLELLNNYIPLLQTANENMNFPLADLRLSQLIIRLQRFDYNLKYSIKVCSFLIKEIEVHKFKSNILFDHLAFLKISPILLLDIYLFFSLFLFYYDCNLACIIYQNKISLIRI